MKNTGLCSPVSPNQCHEFNDDNMFISLPKLQNIVNNSKHVQPNHYQTLFPQYAAIQGNETI